MKKLFGVLCCILSVALVLTGCNFAINTFNQNTEVEAPPCTLMFLGSTEDINTGELYYQAIGQERERLAETALKDEYVIAPNTQAVLLLNKENELYLKQQNGEKTKISSGVKKSSYCFSKDESTIAFLVENADEQNPGTDLYIQKLNADKEKITSGLSVDATKSNYSISSDGSVIFFQNAENVLYKWSKATDKEKLANDVKSFHTFADMAAYSYINMQDVHYVKFANDTESQKVSVDGIADLKMTEDGLMAIFTGTYNWDKGYGELYAVIKGSDSVKIASNVKNFTNASNNNLYYMNDEGVLYRKKLPNVNKNSSKFTDEINNGQKDKICPDVTHFEISPNGNNCAAIDNDNNLYLSYNQKEKTKVASDIVNVRMFDSSILFLNKDNQLYLNSVLEDSENIRDNNKMIAQLVTNFHASENGKYILFTTSENNALMLCTDGAKPEEVIADCSTYDIVVSQRQKVYEKKLMLPDIAGIYKNTDLGVAYKITKEGQFTLYEKGEEKEVSNLILNGLNRLSAELKSDNADSVLSQENAVFALNTDGTKFINFGDAQYQLEAIDEDGLTQEIARQKKAEAEAKAAAERKAAAEKAAAELKARKEEAESRARDYYANNVYVSSYETLYYSPSYSSASGRNFTNSHWATVYDYQVSSDGWTIWLKLRSSEGNYWWVSR